MTVRLYIHLSAKRAETIALVDSRAMENFINIAYTKWLQLPIKQLPKERKLLNVDGTENRLGWLWFYTDLNVRTGNNHTTLWFFLSNLGDHKAILEYPWFAATQPCIDWKRGWIDHEQLPIVLHAPDAKKATFVPRTRNIPTPIQQDWYFIGQIIIKNPSSDADLSKVPEEFHSHAKVFSEQQSQRLPQHTI
jgi:hypothetical protein